MFRKSEQPPNFPSALVVGPVEVSNGGAKRGRRLRRCSCSRLPAQFIHLRPDRCDVVAPNPARDQPRPALQEPEFDHVVVNEPRQGFPRNPDGDRLEGLTTGFALGAPSKTPRRPVTDENLQNLKGFGDLRWLNLRQNPITDAGLANLAALEQITFLDLGKTKITDEGLSKLKGLKHLETLVISDTPVTPAGIKELQDALPKLKIDVLRETETPSAVNR